MKGVPYNIAVAEVTYKIIKTEFINHRIHSSLNYLMLREFEENTLKKVVEKVLPIYNIA